MPSSASEGFGPTFKGANQDNSIDKYLQIFMHVGYLLNCLDVPFLKACPKPFLTEVGIYHRMESCAAVARGILFHFYSNLLGAGAPPPSYLCVGEIISKQSYF